MIRVICKEYVKDNIAVRKTIVTLFYIPIYIRHETTTNNIIINSLISKDNSIDKIKGFRL